MKRTIIIFFIFLFQIIFFSDAEALTWKEVLELAGKNSNTIKSSKKQLESAKWTYKESFSGFLPQLSADFSMRTSTSNTRSYSYGLNATQYIFKGMENYYKVKSAKADYEYYKANLNKAKSDEFYTLRLAFIDLLIAQENLDILTNIYARRKENSRLLQLRYESGREDKGSLLLTKAAELEAENNIVSAKRELKLAQLKLFHLLDHKVPSTSEKIKIKDINGDNFTSLLEKSPSHIMEEYKLKGYEIDKKSVISKFLPSVYLSGNLGKRGNTWPPASSTNSWSFNISYSLFTGGSDIANKKIYSLEYEEAKENFILAKKELYYDIEEAYKNYADAVDLLKVKKKYLEATYERAKISRAKYINGLTSYDEWNRTEDAYISAEKSYLSYQSSALSAEANYYKSYGDWVK